MPEKIGTLMTALLDPAQKKVMAVRVDTGNKTTMLPWSEIQPIHQPNDQFRTAATAQALADATQRSGDNNLIDVEQALIGRPVIDAAGKKVGTVGDVVAQVSGGVLDYIVVHPSGPSLGTSNARHAVPWGKVKPISREKSRPIEIAVNDEQLASMPVLGASKAQETGGRRDAGQNAGATEPPAP